VDDGVGVGGYTLDRVRHAELAATRRVERQAEVPDVGTVDAAQPDSIAFASVRVLEEYALVNLMRRRQERRKRERISETLLSGTGSKQWQTVVLLPSHVVTVAQFSPPNTLPGSVTWYQHFIVWPAART
jgi:hypothetical protein